MNERDASITAQAILKSVIESGADEESWDSMTGHGLDIWTKYKNALTTSASPPTTQQATRKTAPATNVAPGELAVLAYKDKPTKNGDHTSYSVRLRNSNGDEDWFGTINDDDGSILKDAFGGGHKIKAEIEINGKFKNLTWGSVEIVDVGEELASSSAW